VAFVEGDGTTQPEGFLTSDDWTSTSAGIDSADDLVNLFYSVPSTYASRGSWLMSRNVMGTIRLYRSAPDGPFVWIDSIAPGQPPTLLGRPVVEMPGLANPGGGSPITPVVAFGDWGAAYRIFDRVGLEVLRDPYTKARYSIVCFHCRRRTGGALVNGEAVAGIT
jgi:HK97 family phage major capsid protein